MERFMEEPEFFNAFLVKQNIIKQKKQTLIGRT